MRAIVCIRQGDPTIPLGSSNSALAVEQRTSLPILPGHVRISVVAASLNFPDALQVQGQYQVKPPLPFIPGSEVSGVVTELGSGVKRLTLGDRVCAICMGGAFAEEVVVSEGSVWPVPEGLELESAAAIPVVYGTADLAIRHKAKLQKGQTLLVLGAAGGVGVAACQIGKALGAKVVAVVSGPEKAQFMRSLGVDLVVDASACFTSSPAKAGSGPVENRTPLHKAIKALAPKGADVVFDPVGGAMFDEALKAASPWGAQYLVIGFASGTIPKVPVNLLLVKNMTLHGIFWGSYLQRQPQILFEGMAQVFKWFKEGKLSVQVSHRFPMDRVDEAFRAMLQRRVMGKALITMKDISKL